MENKSTIKWISHRGLSQHAAENSLTSFKLACKAGFTWLETDLQATKDNHIVLSHDSDLSKISFSSQNIVEMSRSNLEKIQLKKGGQLLFFDDFMLEFDKEN